MTRRSRYPGVLSSNVPLDSVPSDGVPSDGLPSDSVSSACSSAGPVSPSHRLGPVARMRGVVVGAQGRVVAPLRGIDLDVEPGTLTVLVGGPGSGTDTALLVLAGLLPPEDGDVDIVGTRIGAGSSATDPRAQPQVWRSRVGYVPQRPIAVGYLTVAENLALPATLAGSPADGRRAERLLQTLRLEQVAERYPDELTGIQRRCLALGQVLVYAPDLIVVAAEPPEPEPAPTVTLATSRAAGLGGALLAESPKTSTSSRAGSRTALVDSLIELVELDGHTVITAMTDPALRRASHHTVELDQGRVVRWS